VTYSPSLTTQLREFDTTNFRKHWRRNNLTIRYHLCQGGWRGVKLRRKGKTVIKKKPSKERIWPGEREKKGWGLKVNGSTHRWQRKELVKGHLDETRKKKGVPSGHEIGTKGSLEGGNYNAKEFLMGEKKKTKAVSGEGIQAKKTPTKHSSGNESEK